MNDSTTPPAPPDTSAGDGSAFPWRTIDTAPIDTASDYLFAMIVWGHEDDQSVGCGMRYKGEWFAAGTFYRGGLGTQRQYEMREYKVSPTHWAPRLPLPNAANEPRSEAE